MQTQNLQAIIKQTMTNSVYRDKIKRLSLFGSQLHGSAKTDSDIDLLVEFNQPVGYFELVRIEKELTQALGQPVDLVTPDSLSKYFRETVIREAQPLYAI